MKAIMVGGGIMGLSTAWALARAGHDIELFEQALAELSGMPHARVSALVHDKCGTSFHALYHKAGLPVSAYPAFCEALEAMQEGGFVGSSRGATNLRRRMVERVLTRFAENSPDEIGPLLTLLRRFAAEAAREEARALCDDLVADLDWLDEHARDAA